MKNYKVAAMNGDLYSISNGELTALLPHVQTAAREAGALVMKFYRAAALDIKTKPDNSPVTNADLESSVFLESRLAVLTPGVTVVSEENESDAPAEAIYWAVDPLDGTKEFINQTDGFSIRIALMENGVPALGVVYAPALHSLYSGLRGGLATRQTGLNPPKDLSVRENSKYDLRVLFNATHCDAKLYDVQRTRFLQRGVTLPAVPESYPGLPRNLRVAEGLADMHVATGAENDNATCGFIWDNAADWLILTNAGGQMCRLSDGAPLTFGAPRRRMPSYVAIGDKNLGIKLFPEP